MAQTSIIFFSGIGGVFIGMGLLYLAIRLTSRFTQPFENRQKDKR